MSFNLTQMVDFYMCPSALQNILPFAVNFGNLLHGRKSYFHRVAHITVTHQPMCNSGFGFKGVKENESPVSCYDVKERDQPMWYCCIVFLIIIFII